MKEENRLLEVGDKVVVMSHGKPKEIITISRVSKTMAFYKIREDYEGRLYRKISDYGSIRPVSPASWSFTSYLILTEELQEKYNRTLLEQKAKALIDRARMEKLSDVELNQIVKLLETNH